MSLQEQMIVANIRNWLTDLAIGAKASATKVRFASCEESEAFKYEAGTYEDFIRDNVPTVLVHNLKELAEAADLEIQHRKLKKGDYYYGSFVSEDFFVFNDVKFSDMTLKNGVWKNERK